MKAIIKKTKNKQFRFNLVADNGEIIATSETYTRRTNAVKTLKKYFPRFTIMKKLIIAVIAITLFSCTKSGNNSMTVEQLKSSTGIDLIAAWDIQFGNARVTPKVKRPDKNDVVNLIEGSLQFDGTTFTTSDRPKFAGVNNQTTVVSICNWFFFDENGSAQTLTCNNSTGSGSIMAWNTDWDDNVYRSNLIIVP